jgi:hypothetical protein
MESTCLRTRSPPTCGPICGHSASSPEMRRTGSLARLAGVTGLRRAGSDAAGSLFLVAFCTDTLRESRFAALQFRSTRDAERSRGHACKILREMKVSRDGLDHILDAVSDQTSVGALGDLPKVRTTSQMRPQPPMRGARQRSSVRPQPPTRGARQRGSVRPQPPLRDARGCWFGESRLRVCRPTSISLKLHRL